VRVFGEGRDKLDASGLISISDDGRWTVITVSHGWNRTSVHLRDGAGEFVPFFDGPDEKAFAWFAGDRLVALTNAGAPRFRLVEIDPARPRAANWRDVIPESEHVLVDVAVTADRLAAHHLGGPSSRVSLHAPGGALERPIDLPPLRSRAALGGRHGTTGLYVTVETFARPAATSLVGGGELERIDPPEGFDPSRYPVRQVWFESRDGTRLPMFLIGRAEGSGPAVVTGYGGFS